MNQHISNVHDYLKQNNIDAFLLPMADYHGSEFLSGHFLTIKWLTGFSGSAATLLITQESAYLWTDGRYFLQGEIELMGSGIVLMKSGEDGVPTMPEKLVRLISNHYKSSKEIFHIAFDGRLISINEYQNILDYFRSMDLDFSSLVKLSADVDIARLLWKDRPELTATPIFPLPLSSTGRSSMQKIANVREQLEKIGASSLLLSSMEEIAWLFNLRGKDLPTSPLFMAFAIIGRFRVMLFIQNGSDIDAFLPPDTMVLPYEDFWKYLEKENLESPLLLSPSASLGIYYRLKHNPNELEVLISSSPIEKMKIIKNSMEVISSKKAHLLDGLAMVRFFYSLEKLIKKTYKNNGELKKGQIPPSEYTISEMILKERASNLSFICPSFETIAGYRENGAIVHYTPTKDGAKILEPNGLLLIDSGGHYIEGTTDITRTIALGSPTEEEKRAYTAVLKSHIALATAKFTEDTTGKELDFIARKPLNHYGFNYNHGTGHGVGHVLSVHEGPNVISPRNNEATIQAGTITTDEPGVYLEGKFGIRLENELLATRDGNYLKFVPLTLCPFDFSLVLTDELTPPEKTWLENYHKDVFQKLAPHLDRNIQSWLRNKCLDFMNLD